MSTRHQQDEHQPDHDGDRNRKKPHRSIVRVACNACRSRKVGCDATRPACSACQNSGRECIYDTSDDGETRAMALRRDNQRLRAESERLQSTLEWLMMIPDEQVLQFIRQSRASSAAIGQHPGAMATWPSSPPPLLVVRERPAIFTHVPDGSSIPPSLGTSTPVSPLHQQPLVGISPSPTQLSPLHDPAGFVSNPTFFNDERTRGLHITFWTGVPISDQLAGSVISFYLAADLGSSGYFDADLFLMDLQDQNPRYCSRLMTSSLLFLACQMFSQFSSQAAALSTQFLEEAKNLVDVGSFSDEYCNVASLLLLGLGCSYIPSSEDSLPFTHRGCEMAQRLAASDRASLTGTNSSPEAAEMRRFKTRILSAAFRLSAGMAEI